MVEQQFQRDNPLVGIPDLDHITKEQLETLLTRYVRAKGNGNADVVARIDAYLADASFSASTGGFRGSTSNVDAFHRRPDLSVEDAAEFGRMIRGRDNVPPVLGLTGRPLRNFLLARSPSEINELLHNELTDDQFLQLEVAAAGQGDTGLDIDLLEVATNPEIVTSFGVYKDKGEDLRLNLQGEFNEFFSDTETVVAFAEDDATRVFNLLSEADLTDLTRSTLLYTYEFFKANDRYDTADEALNSSNYRRGLDRFAAIIIDIEAVSQTRDAEGNLVSNVLPQNDPAIQEILGRIRDPFLAQLVDKATSEAWLTNTVTTPNESSATKEVPLAVYSVFLTDVSRALDFANGGDDHNTFALSMMEEYTTRYQTADTTEDFTEWARTNLLPNLHHEMVNRQPVNREGRDEIVSPIIDDMLRGMPFAFRQDARTQLLFQMWDQKNFTAGITTKQQMLDQFWSPEARTQWMNTYIGTEMLPPEHREEINEIVKLEKIDLLGLLKQMLSPSVDEDGVANEFAGWDENSSPNALADALLNNLKTLSPAIETATAEPVPGSPLTIEQGLAFAKVLNPLLIELGVPQYLRGRIKDAYIADSDLPTSGSQEEILNGISGIQMEDFGTFAKNYTLDILTNNIDNGEIAVEQIQRTNGGDPFPWLHRRGLDGDDITTLGELERRIQESITTPEETSVLGDQLINKQAEFLPKLSIELQEDVRVALRRRLSELAAQAGMSLDDFIEAGGNFGSDLKEAAEVELNRLLTDDEFQARVEVNTGGSTVDFIVENEGAFKTLTADEIVEASQDIELDEVVAGENVKIAGNRAIVAQEEHERAVNKELDQLKLEKSINDARRARETAEDRERREELELQDALRQREVVTPFEEAFDAQAGKFLFGPRGREVIQDTRAEQLRAFESRLEGAQQAVIQQGGERASFQDLLGGGAGAAEFLGKPSGGRSVIQQFSEENFGAEFFTEAARKSRAARTPAPRVGVGRQQAVPEFRLGATGGR